MNADLKAAVKINSLAGKVRPFDLMMDLITRYGHWAFVIHSRKDKGRQEKCMRFRFYRRMHSFAYFLCHRTRMET